MTRLWKSERSWTKDAVISTFCLRSSVRNRMCEVWAAKPFRWAGEEGKPRGKESVMLSSVDFDAFMIGRTASHDRNPTERSR